MKKNTTFECHPALFLTYEKELSSEEMKKDD